MKKFLILSGLLLFAGFNSISAATNSITNSMLDQYSVGSNDPEVRESLKKIDVTFTSNKGCKFRIKGDYDLWNGTFSGSLTASGEPPCPNESWTFGIAPGVNGATTVFGSEALLAILAVDIILYDQLIAAIKR